MDSLQNQLVERTRIPGLTASVKLWAINTAIQQVCEDFPALPKMDTVTLRFDSIGAAFNTDFLRPLTVFKLYGDTLWLPTLRIGIDTFSFQVLDTSTAGGKYNSGDPNAGRIWFELGNFDTTRMFIQPKFVDGDSSQTWLVNYAAADKWIISTDSVTRIQKNYRDEVIDYAAYLVHFSRGNHNDADRLLLRYEKKLGIATQ